MCQEPAATIDALGDSVYQALTKLQHLGVAAKRLFLGGPQKMSTLPKLKYNNAIADAMADLGRPEEIGNVFAGFQKHLNQQVA